MPGAPPLPPLTPGPLEAPAYERRGVDPWRGTAPGGEGAAVKIAALFVEADGCYSGLTGVDPWPKARDARLYAGPHRVVAHPPCQRRGKFWAGSPLAIARTGRRLAKGDDAGCFAAALASVRRFGGVIEHPAGSHAWAHFGLNAPPRCGGWVVADFVGGWTCHVEQGFYGHFARKPTWLYACGVDLPSLRWGRGERRLNPEIVARYGRQRAIRLGEIGGVGGGVGGGGDDRERAATPPAFRDLLLSIVRTAQPARVAA